MAILNKTSKAQPVPLLPAQIRAAKKHRELLHAASDLFLERGYDAVSIADVVTLAGGSKTNVYKHFNDKDGLFLAVVEALCAELQSQARYSDVTGMPLAKALRETGLAFLKMVLERRALALQQLVMTEARRFPQAGRLWLQSRTQASLAPCAALLATRQKSKELRGGDPHAAAALWLDLLGGELQQLMLFGVVKRPSREWQERKVDSAVQLFLAGFGKR